MSLFDHPENAESINKFLAGACVERADYSSEFSKTGELIWFKMIKFSQLCSYAFIEKTLFFWTLSGAPTWAVPGLLVSKFMSRLSFLILNNSTLSRSTLERQLLDYGDIILGYCYPDLTPGGRNSILSGGIWMAFRKGWKPKSTKLRISVIGQTFVIVRPWHISVFTLSLVQ